MRDDKQEICKELGDVLLHVAFYAKIGSETGDFDMKDVCDKLCEKLIFRHPHVFGEVKAETAGQVSENWEQLKLKEKDGNKSVLSGVPAALPSLIKAYRIQDKARNVGFDWEEREQVWDKVKEEIAKILKDEGFIEDYTIDGEGVQKNITLTLKYKNKERVITGLKRISKPGLRVYAGKDELPTVLNGLGIAIISTSKGIMTDKEARKLSLGGEVVAYIW